MLKKIFKIIFVFVIGIGGGIFADQILWPYFIERPLFYKYRLEQAPVYVTEKKEIKVEENTALQNVAERMWGSIITVRTKTKKGKIIEGSGVIVSSDGYAVTLAELLPKGGKFEIFFGGKAPVFQVLKRDVKNNLALIKIEMLNLQTFGYADSESIKLGQRVFLLGEILANNEFQKTINEGIVKKYSQGVLYTNILEKEPLSGAPVFNIKGELVGLSLINSQGEVSVIPSQKIRQFCGF